MSELTPYLETAGMTDPLSKVGTSIRHEQQTSSHLTLLLINETSFDLTLLLITVNNLAADLHHNSCGEAVVTYKLHLHHHSPVQAYLCQEIW